MKAKLTTYGIAALAAAGCLIGVIGPPTTEQKTLTLSNVEALTRTEITFELDKDCIEYHRDYCVLSYYLPPFLGHPVN